MGKPKKTLDLRFPVGGYDRYTAYGQQRPFTTPDCLNVRPVDTLEERERGGQRPGVGKFKYTELGSPSLVNMLGRVTWVNTDVFDFWGDTFQGSGLGGIWEQATHLTDPPVVISSFAAISSDTAEEVAVMRAALDGFDATEKYEIGLFLAPYKGRWAGRYNIYLRMATVPDFTDDGVRITLEMVGDTGDYTGRFDAVDSGTTTTTAFTPGTLGAVKPGWFVVRVDGDTVEALWHGTSVGSITAHAAVGSDFGFGLHALEALPGEAHFCLVDTFLIRYRTTDSGTGDREAAETVLVASAGSTLYRATEGRIGHMTALSPTCTLVADKQVQTAERGGKLYIADHDRPRADLTDGVVDAAGTGLTSASISDWTTLGISIPNDVVIIEADAGSVKAGSYKITSVAVGSLTTTDSMGGAGSSVSFRIERAPKVYDPSDDSCELLVATKGQVPTGCTAIARYRDRIVLAGGNTNPHVWFMSRSGDPEDWFFAGDDFDVQRAVSGTSAEAGRIADHVKAIISFSDDQLLFGCRNSLWLLRGDPAYDGQLDNLSYNIGVVGPGAWCRTATGEVIFLSRDGLYGLPPSLNAFPESLSRQRLPLELRDIDSETSYVNMAYDVRDRGIHIVVTPVDPGRGVTQYWFDWDTKSFWPTGYTEDHEPGSMLEFHGEFSENTSVLYGCRDGFIRRHHSLFETDDGTSINSHVVYGPFRPGGDNYHEGRLAELWAAVGEDGGNVAVKIFGGETAEEVVNSDTALDDHEWEPGFSYKIRPRTRAGFLTIKLEDQEDSALLTEDRDFLLTEDGDRILIEQQDRKWGIEQLTAVFQQAGRQRKGGA